MRYHLDFTIDKKYKAVGALKNALVWVIVPNSAVSLKAAELAKIESEKQQNAYRNPSRRHTGHACA